jgi:hypothetical protein
VVIASAADRGAAGRHHGRSRARRVTTMGGDDGAG